MSKNIRRDKLAEQCSWRIHHELVVNTIGAFKAGWDAAAADHDKLEKENEVLRECLEYIDKNCELIRYELVDGDGAPSGYLPYPHDMGFVRKALEQADKVQCEV